MPKFIIIYRAGSTYQKIYSHDDQTRIAEDWERWVNSLGDEYVDSSPIERDGYLISKNRKSEIPIGENLINGFIIIESTDIERVTELCKSNPLFIEGKTMEIRELPS